MKIVLTESQYRILEEGTLSTILCESLIQESSFDNVMEKIKASLVAGVSVPIIMAAVDKLPYTQSQKDEIKAEIQNMDTEKDGSNTISLAQAQADTTFAKRVDAVKRCMAYGAFNKGWVDKNLKAKLGIPWNIDSKKINELTDEQVDEISKMFFDLTPEKLVEICDKHGFDLPLAVAQAYIESLFGKMGRASRTNSVWNQGAYDDGRDMCVFSNADDSIEPYITLVLRDYMFGTKTYMDLLKPGGYVNSKGMRYASSPDYETKLNGFREKLIRMFPNLAI